MGWELHLRNAGKESFYLWQRGTYEECVAEMFSMRERGSIEISGMRLTWEPDDEERPMPPGRDRPSRAVVEDGVIRDVTLHQHTWSEDLDRMVWRCPCGATVTWEEVHRAGQAASPDLLSRIWVEKQQ